MDTHENEFWVCIDKLFQEAILRIERSKGSAHPRYPEFMYPVDYGYLEGTTSMDGSGIDVWIGSANNKTVHALICTVDLTKRDSEIKLLYGCTEEEIQTINDFHNRTSYMKGIILRRK